MPSLEIIETGFRPVIHYNITAKAALWSLPSQRQDHLRPGLGERQGRCGEAQGSTGSLPRRNLHIQKCPGHLLMATGALMERLLCVGAYGTGVTKQTLVPVFRELTLAWRKQASNKESHEESGEGQVLGRRSTGHYISEVTELRPEGRVRGSSGRSWRESILGGDTAHAKVLRWAKCGMFQGKKMEREGQNDKPGARTDQQAPLDRGKGLRF